MKTCMNLLLWSTDVTEETFSVMTDRKETECAAVEIPLGPADPCAGGSLSYLIARSKLNPRPSPQVNVEKKAKSMPKERSLPTNHSRLGRVEVELTCPTLS